MVAPPLTGTDVPPAARGFKSTRMITALAILSTIIFLCVIVAFYDRKMVIAISGDPTPSHALMLRARVPTPGSEIAEKLSFPIDVINATTAEVKAVEDGAGTKSDGADRHMLQETDAGSRPRPGRTGGADVKGRHPPNGAARRHGKDNSTKSSNSNSTSSSSGGKATDEPSYPVHVPYYIPPFRLIQDDLSGKFDNNRWEVTHIVRNDSLREVRWHAWICLSPVDGPHIQAHRPYPLSCATFLCGSCVGPPGYALSCPVVLSCPGKHPQPP